MLGYTFMDLYEAESKIKWPVYVFYRFFRLAPAMVAVGLLYICLWPALGSGPSYPAKAPDEDVCKELWYYTFFFINTIVDVDKCMGWTWYLSVDFQLYLVSPFLLVPIIRGYKKIGTTLAVVVSVFFMVVAGLISHHYKLAETAAQIQTKDGGFSNLYTFLDKLYYKPYCRVAPYIVGVLMGYAFKITDRKIHVPKTIVMLGWSLSTIVGLSVIFGIYGSYSHHRLATITEAAVYNAVKDPLFGLSVAWVIFACVTGNGGFINTILSWKGFIVLSRTTYCMYLLHIPVQFFFAFSLEGAVWWSESFLISNWFGLWFISALLAVIISLTTEAPSLRAEKLILEQMGFNVS